MVLEQIKALFEPKSVAVVGASREPWKTGHIILKNIVDAGFKGKIYPINPKATEILGLKVYPSLSRVPDDIDMMVVVVPARIVPRIMEEAGEKGVKAAVIISGGFAETGPEGAKLQEKVVKIARKYGIRLVIDPNKSRCPHCNTLLKHVLASEFEELNITTWRPPVSKEEYWICPTCKQIYWRGKHFRSISNILKRAKEISKLLDINSR